MFVIQTRYQRKLIKNLKEMAVVGEAEASPTGKGGKVIFCEGGMNSPLRWLRFFPPYKQRGTGTHLLDIALEFLPVGVSE